MATFRLWLWRLFLVAIWSIIYAILPEPVNAWFGILTGILVALWLYNRASGRFNLPPLRVKFEKAETLTLTHVLMALILIVMVANLSELAKLRKATIDVQDSVTDLQNSASNNTDEIKSGLDDVTSAIEANH